MKNVLGGLFPIQLLFDNCVAEATNGLSPGSTEYEIMYSICANDAENRCAREIAMGRDCYLNIT